MLRANATTLDDLCEVATRPLDRPSRRFWLLAGGLAVLVLWGVVAYVVQLVQGLGAAGYDDQSFWGIYEANLVSFIAVSYGGALVSAILRLTQARWRAPITRLAESMAVISLLVGMTFALIHLGRPDRIWRMVFTPQLGSPIVWDFIVIMMYLAATLVFLYLPMIPDLAILGDRQSARTARWTSLYRRLSLGWRGSPEQRRLLDQGVATVAILIIPLAVFVHSVLSWAFALTGRPGWDSTIFAPYFVVAALYAGVAMVILVVAGFRKGYHLEGQIGLKQFRYLGYLLLTLDLMYLYFTFTEMLTEGYVMNEATVPVLEALLLGQYAPFFWAFVLASGVVPLLLVVIPRTRTVAGIVVASSLVVAGMWLKRLLIVVPVVASPRIAGAWGTFGPTWVAVGVTIGAAAAIPLLLMLFFRLFPVLSIDEMLEVAAEGEQAAASGRRADLTLPEGGVAR
jgi:Ni/Fe-hydrogenase subunit HybB-like protein